MSRYILFGAFALIVIAGTLLHLRANTSQNNEVTPKKHALIIELVVTSDDRGSALRVISRHLVPVMTMKQHTLSSSSRLAAQVSWFSIDKPVPRGTGIEFTDFAFAPVNWLTVPIQAGRTSWKPNLFRDELQVTQEYRYLRPLERVPGRDAARPYWGVRVRHSSYQEAFPPVDLMEKGDKRVAGRF